jgi:hypothetical protein
MDDCLLSPIEYCTELPGTTACISFTLRRWAINDKKVNLTYDTFAADIETIHILAPPPPPVEVDAPLPVTPGKRKFEMCEPMTPSPKKAKKSGL